MKISRTKDGDAQVILTPSELELLSRVVSARGPMLSERERDEVASMGYWLELLSVAVSTAH